MSNPQPKTEADPTPGDEIEREIAELVADHGSAHAALRAVLHDMDMLMADADRSTSRGFLRGRFSQGMRPVPDAE